MFEFINALYEYNEYSSVMHTYQVRSSTSSTKNKELYTLTSAGQDAFADTHVMVPCEEINALLHCHKSTSCLLIPMN